MEKKNGDEANTNYIKSLPVLDAHFDLAPYVLSQRGVGRRQVLNEDFLREFRKGGISLVVSSLFVDNALLPEMALKSALRQIDALTTDIAECQNEFMLCRSHADALRARKEKKIGIFLSFEGAEPIYNDLALLRIFYELGVRLVGLVWSRRNYAGDGCSFTKVAEGKKGGLTAFGMSLLAEAEKLGMIIDVSHLNDEGFWDVMKFSKKPFIASHSNCRALVNSMRNLTDAQIKGIADKGGVIGVNALNFIVAENDENSTIKGLADHIDHIVDLVGIDHVGFGFDLCDKLHAGDTSMLKAAPRMPFDVMKDHGEVADLILELRYRGYGETDLERIAGGNFERLFNALIPG